MKRNVIVVERDRRFFTAVELKSEGDRLRVIRTAVHELPDGEVNPNWVNNLWKLERFSRHDVLCSLPSSLVKYKTLVLPAVPADQLEAAVEMELGEDGTAEDIYRMVHHRLEDGKHQVKVGIIKQDDLRAHLNFWRKAGLDVSWSVLRTNGIENYVRHCFNAFGNRDGVLYLDATAGLTELGFFRDGSLVYHRVFGFMPNDRNPEETEESLKEFLHELRLSLAAAEKAAGDPLPDRMYLFGLDFVFPTLAGPVMDKFGIRLLPPDGTRVLNLADPHEISRISPLIGVALTRMERNPRPAQKIYAAEQIAAAAAKRRTKTIAEIGLGLLFLLAGFGFLCQARRIREDKIRRWLAQKAEILVELRRTKQLSNEREARIRFLESWLAQQGRELEFLRLLDLYLPEGTKITDITIENGVIKDLAGYTPSVSLLLDDFRAVPALRALKLKGAVVIGEKGEQFHLEGPISFEETKR